MSETKNEPNFPKGFSFKLPHEKAPDFVKGKVSIKIDEAIQYLTGLNASGETWLNLNAKVSKGGKSYLEVDTWKPDGAKGGGTPQKTGEPTGTMDMSTGDECPY